MKQTLGRKIDNFLFLGANPVQRKQIKNNRSKLVKFFFESFWDLRDRQGKALLYAIPLLAIFPILEELKQAGLSDSLYLLITLTLLGVALILFWFILKSLFLAKNPARPKFQKPS